MALVASTEAAVGASGHAVILEGLVADHQPLRLPETVLALGLKGNSRIEWKRGGRLSRFVGAPGCFTVLAAGQENSFHMDQAMQTLNVVFASDQLRALADREWKPYGRTIEISQVYHQNTPEIVTLAQAFAALVRAPGREVDCTPRLSGPRSRSSSCGISRRCRARESSRWTVCRMRVAARRGLPGFVAGIGNFSG